MRRLARHVPLSAVDLRLPCRTDDLMSSSLMSRVRPRCLVTSSSSFRFLQGSGHTRWTQALTKRAQNALQMRHMQQAGPTPGGTGPLTPLACPSGASLSLFFPKNRTSAKN